MTQGDVYDIKHDSASEYSMDSAYQSQRSASRRGITMSEGFQPVGAQDNRIQMNNRTQMDNHYCTPGFSSDDFFADSQPTMGPMNLPSTTVDGGTNTFAYANLSPAQDYSSYPIAANSHFDMGFQQWGTATPQPFHNAFIFTPHPRPAHNLDTAMYQNEPNEMFFNGLQPASRPLLDASVRTVSSGSSFTTHEASHPNPIMMSPSTALVDFEQLLEARTDKEETVLTSLAAKSIADEEDLLSPRDAAEAKNMEEEQGKAARSHKLYQAQPDASGQYHCPQEGQQGCTHRPTNLKCNYDKYVDSHLKPFRCNKKVCIGVQFSSTACLLRHEREAHGMHGHGSRPHLCQFEDCERSVDGHGFPRRYNLFDHMKRVHDFTGPTTEPSPAPTPAPTARKNISRKRKSTAEEIGEKRQKVAKQTAQEALEQHRKQLQADFMTKRQHIINTLIQLASPDDLREDLQLTKEVMRLHDLATDFKKSSGG
ncbi:hypothetical protein K504DRAFT_252767 [Pleomassaria siparia CBS 279.74]|uniref:C2H2-type domain-containing protein n=1 Tax=Pleomassaria siparia CBS 279.74 TaxID=1314801 RepID=A0A6G1KBF7_9PLEO|nr:hypothetical protein K504DRAFT_252767 [Pleomassaria siparia CBS 279.74]